MEVETSFDLVVARSRLGSFGFCPPMNEAVFSGNVLRLAAFGPFSGDPKVDDLGHQESRVTG